MKNMFLVLSGVLLLSSGAFAETVKVISCELSSYYLSANITVEKSFEVLTGESEAGDNVVLDFSESECEDSTTITVSKADREALEKGKTVEAEVQHSEPDVTIQGFGACSLKTVETKADVKQPKGCKIE